MTFRLLMIQIQFQGNRAGLCLVQGEEFWKLEASCKQRESL